MISRGCDLCTGRRGGARRRQRPSTGRFFICGRVPPSYSCCRQTSTQRTCSKNRSRRSPLPSAARKSRGMHEAYVHSPLIAASATFALKTGSGAGELSSSWSLLNRSARRQAGNSTWRAISGTTPTSVSGQKAETDQAITRPASPLGRTRHVRANAVSNPRG